MYALSDVGYKTAGDGTHCQSDGKLKVDDKVLIQSSRLYVYKTELEYQLATGHLSSSTIINLNLLTHCVGASLGKGPSQ